MEPKFRFADIGFKYFSMPEGLSLREYHNLIDEHRDRWLSEKDENGITRERRLFFHEGVDVGEDESALTEEELRYIQNRGERLSIIFHLEDIPEAEWTEKDRNLMKYMISDIDFFSSEWQFREIVKQCPNSG